MKWRDGIDPSTIPDAVLKTERARRNSAKRQTFGGGTGRPKVMRKCPGCGAEFSTSDLRLHKCVWRIVMYDFGLGKGWLSERAVAVAEEHGAELMQIHDAHCDCGHGCEPFSCDATRRHFFRLTESQGEPHDNRRALEVLAALREEGLL